MSLFLLQLFKNHKVSGSSSCAWDVIINFLLAAIDITELYNALLRAEERDGIVKLKDSHGNSLNFPVEAHDTLIVRNADKHLWRLFSRVVLDGECIDGDAFESMLVLGPEGVGKVCVFDVTVVVFCLI